MFPSKNIISLNQKYLAGHATEHPYRGHLEHLTKPRFRAKRPPTSQRGRSWAVTASQEVAQRPQGAAAVVLRYYSLHYQKIILALKETDRLMNEVDGVEI